MKLSSSLRRDFFLIQSIFTVFIDVKLALDTYDGIKLGRHSLCN